MTLSDMPGEPPKQRDAVISDDRIDFIQARYHY
jgi:hypothetical protein